MGISVCKMRKTEQIPGFGSAKSNDGTSRAFGSPLAWDLGILHLGRYLGRTFIHQLYSSTLSIAGCETENAQEQLILCGRQVFLLAGQ